MYADVSHDLSETRRRWGNWLSAGRDDQWHTIACIGVATDPALEAFIRDGADHNLALQLDTAFSEFLNSLTIRRGRLRLLKWTTAEAYRGRFIDAFHAMAAAPLAWRPFVNALSFQEGTLRRAKSALLAAYNGTRRDHDIGFVEHTDRKGRRMMRHEFVNFSGYHVLERLESQMLVLLVMAWTIADQYRSFERTVPQHGFDRASLTVVSDTLSGDSSLLRDSELVLRRLLDTNAATELAHPSIRVTHSAESDSHPGDLLADNLAGWMAATLQAPRSTLGTRLLESESIAQILSWNELVQTHAQLSLKPVLPRLREDSRTA